MISYKTLGRYVLHSYVVSTGATPCRRSAKSSLTSAKPGTRELRAAQRRHALCLGARLATLFITRKMRRHAGIAIGDVLRLCEPEGAPAAEVVGVVLDVRAGAEGG